MYHLSCHCFICSSSRAQIHLWFMYNVRDDLTLPSLTTWTHMTVDTQSYQWNTNTHEHTNTHK